MQVKEVRARKIRDSRGEDTIEVSVNGCKASAPEGKSKGKYETPPYYQSLEWNVQAMNKLFIKTEITSFFDLEKVEEIISYACDFDNTKQFGANALFALESAILKALAKEQKKELWQIVNEKAKRFPIPVGNAIGGGVHSLKFESYPVFQEFLLIPRERSVKENLKIMQSIYNKIGKALKSRKKNDEGAWQCSLNEDEILEFLSKFREKINIGIDVAASSFFRDEFYGYNELSLGRADQIKYINELIRKYNLFYVEDPLDEEDFEGFSEINKEKLIVGDDLTATNLNRLQRAIIHRSINAMIIKPNQNGSLLELKKIFDVCRKSKIKTILSHRSGETMDDALADYAFGFQADYIKCGISTKWREVKLKRLAEIEKEVGK
jgi:enolase